ncbi:MAG: hypothetical protein F4X82_00075 [Candidatus Spechtbacteria bacterium SB0662_bin_43]|uniref:ParB/Sulfiredoxin domain-containing protein n=1 Tax=Candidatus Spechtbacteria bacterium SB0662_bin_43 TaxID=2604897 RepID=A0A845D8Z5_9BACT|nr:hypothetical protein [Candidatus Spechtbacteria bacterium SB0662_bin_43]
MNKEERIRKIGEIIKNKGAINNKIVRWNDSPQRMDAFEIDLKYLIYNKYNGRILSRTKSAEKKGISINPETREGKELIERLLWESHKDRNKKTEQDIKDNGQKEIGVITKDGVIIDGNRRAMILSRLNIPYFNAVVLPITLEENQKEIEKLETVFQMGEDSKLDYKPIEKYLKAENLNKKGFSNEDISEFMQESVKEVEKYLDTMKIMNEYLQHFEYDGLFTRLDKREDQFLHLTKWLNSFYGESSSKAFGGYKDSDVDDLKDIAFEYIRVDYHGKDFRLLADGHSDKHFFGDESIWSSFRDAHYDKIDSLRDDDNFRLDYSNQNLDADLDARDENQKVLEFLTENLDIHKEIVNNKKYKNEPLKLINDAKYKINAIENNKNVYSEEPLQSLYELNNKVNRLLNQHSPDYLLNLINQQISSIESKNCSIKKSECLASLKNIQQSAYQLEKDIKKLKSS